MGWSRIVVFPDVWLGLVRKNVGLIVDIVGFLDQLVIDVSERDGFGTGVVVVVVAVPAVAIVRLGLQVIDVQIAVDPAVGHVSMLARRGRNDVVVHMGVNLRI